MIVAKRIEELEVAISAGASHRQKISTLREYQRSGISRNEVQLALKTLRFGRNQVWLR
jgi:hypothetical protein